MNQTPPVVDFHRLPFRLHGLFAVLCRPVTFDQAEAMVRDGRITSEEFALYKLLWIWSAPRMSNLANASNLQYQFAKGKGWTRLERRFAGHQKRTQWLIRRKLGAWLSQPGSQQVKAALH